MQWRDPGIIPQAPNPFRTEPSRRRDCDPGEVRVAQESFRQELAHCGARRVARRWPLARWHRPLQRPELDPSHRRCRASRSLCVCPSCRTPEVRRRKCRRKGKLKPVASYPPQNVTEDDNGEATGTDIEHGCNDAAEAQSGYAANAMP